MPTPGHHEFRLKEARANELGLKNNTTTLADIASESGQDVDTLLEQRALRSS